MLVLTVILVAILSYCTGYGAMALKVQSGIVETGGRKYMCRDIGPASK